MKRVFLTLSLFIVIGGGLTAPARAGTTAAGEELKPTTAPISTVKPLGVQEFMEHVNQHKGPVVIEGVVSAAAPNTLMVSLIDRREFESCGVVTCAAYTLPVSWAGPFPAVKDVVRVTGQVENAGDGKLVFVANSFEKVHGQEPSK